MNRRLILIASVFVLVMFCSKAPETATTAPAPATTSSAAAAATSAPPTTTQAPAATPATASSAPAPATPTAGSLQTQETNWPGITAEVTEFRRKGNTLTAKVRLINKSANRAAVQIFWRDVALVDAAGGKKYEVLKDEKGAFIAATEANNNDRWDEWVEAGTSPVIWMKFPAPPPEVKTITLQMPKTPPFDDLAIQD